MFCTKCGKAVDDGSSFCPECGQDLRAFSTLQPGIVDQVSPEPDAPISVEEIGNEPDFPETPSPSEPVYAAPAPEFLNTGVIPPAVQSAKPAGDAGSKLGAFFKEYVKSPVTAVASHAKSEFWLWGLLSLAAYLLIHFLISLSGIHSFRGVGYQFGYFVANIVRFATLILAYYLFQSVFKVKKKSLTSVIAVVGLAFLPLLPLYLLGLVFNGIINYSNILSGLMMVAYTVAGIILYSELKESSDDKSGMQSLLTVAASIACMPLISGIIDALVSYAYAYFYY